MSALGHIDEPNKAQINAVSQAQEQPRYEAHLRRIGRGRKRVPAKSYLSNYSTIFGETDIFKNLSKD